MKSVNVWWLAKVVVGVVWLGSGVELQAQRLTWLGTLPGGNFSYATGVSADGSVVVGWAQSANGLTHAFRWTQSGGMQDLGTLGGLMSDARGVSADGSVVVGTAWNASVQFRAFRWTASGGMQDLGTLGGSTSEADGVSADGSVVVGVAENASGEWRAFRWTASGGMQDLGTLGGSTSDAYGVSADGSVVVGSATNASGERRVFRWEGGVMQDIGPFGGGPCDRIQCRYSVSADGSVVIGTRINNNGDSRAVRWTATGGMQEIGTLGGPMSEAYGVSADGSVVVGVAETASIEVRAFRWTASGGMEDLNTTFAALLTNGSVLAYAYAVSPDGRYIVGVGGNAATGRLEAFLLDTEGTTTAVESRGFKDGLQGELRIFPMPSAGAATLRFVSEQVGPVILEVVDVLGRVVFRWSGQVERVGVQSLGVSLGGLSSGRYQVRLRLPGHEVLTAPLMIVR
ncbi:hypothetical protein HRbin18_01062 [bacterium HR18]|nr:hypothetical protein HRbin18_01062 [bacterium HR18]